jgi:hypothetical protein
MWKLMPEYAERTFSSVLANSMLGEHQERLDQYRVQIEKVRASCQERGIQLVGGHVIIPPEGELLQPHWGRLLVFWCSPTLRRKILEEATRIFRHRAKHYTLGTITRLVPEET